MRIKLLLLSILVTLSFTYFSYTVAKERWTKTDFDTTVKLQDHISRKFDLPFSYFSLLGSVEITVGLCLIFSALSLLRRHWLAILGWLMIIPASAGEIFGKLVLFHPGPPVFLHRSVLPTNLPSFYIHTNFSYPSGHITRTVFVVTLVAIIVLFGKSNSFFKLSFIFCLLCFTFLMGLTRVYLGEHWFSDVLGGGLLGFATALFASILVLRKV